MRTLPFSLVDVFARQPLSGNGLCVFVLDEPLAGVTMQRIAQEMRQFETIFLRRTEAAQRYDARIYTVEEELGFAGHPIIGAACVLHASAFSRQAQVRIEFVTPNRTLVATSLHDDGYSAEMEQGVASLLAPLSSAAAADFLPALNLAATDLRADLPLQVVSTGLPYLIVPLATRLERARIVVRDFEQRLARVGAKFVYALDVAAREGRTWDNEGRVEDIATGSAAGPAAAYLHAHGLATANEALLLRQGRHCGRPSQMRVQLRGTDGTISVNGDVSFVGEGCLRLPRSVM